MNFGDKTAGIQTRERPFEEKEAPVIPAKQQKQFSIFILNIYHVPLRTREQPNEAQASVAQHAVFLVAPRTSLTNICRESKRSRKTFLQTSVYIPTNRIILLVFRVFKPIIS